MLCTQTILRHLLTQKQKQGVRDQIDGAVKARDAMKASLRDLRSTMKYTTVAEIDNAIDALESQIQHSSLSLNEEKQTLDEIRKLKSSRGLVAQYSEKQDALAQDDSARSELQATLKNIDAQITEVKKEEEQTRSELSVLREKEQEKGKDFSSLIKERDECREACKQAYEKIKDLRAEHDAVWQEYKAAEKEWRAQQEEDRKIRREKAAAERAAREAERAARLAENAPEPFHREITMCEQLVAYLSRFQTGTFSSARSNGTAASFGKSSNATPADLDGMKLFTKKNVEEEDPWGQLATGKRGKGKGRKSGTAEDVGQEKLVHSLDILEAFAMLKIAVPTNANNASKALQEVTAQHKAYLAKREAAKAAKENDPSGDDTVAASAETPTDGTEGKDGAASSSDGAPNQSSKSKKNGKSSQQRGEALKLDDVTSWPAVGAAGPSAEAAAEEREEASSHNATEKISADSGPPKSSVWSTKMPASSSTPVAVNLSVEDGHGISVAIDVA